ncbi:MAG: hypothetical protein K2M10_00275, partial [Muribaculaceae bacterium]|nr:hypothetical protein [Muribaculaceae bacterium]
MKNRNLIFLKPFSIKNPNLDEQNDFMMTEIVTEVECSKLGRIYNNSSLYGKDLSAFIQEEVEAHNPQWVVGVGQCATIVLNIHNQKKVVLNPKVSYDHLNNVSEFDREHTFGFFDDLHEKDYRRFLTVFPHAVWFPQSDNLNLFTIKEIVEE